MSHEKRVPGKTVYLSALVRGSRYDHAVEEGSTMTVCGLPAEPEEAEGDWLPDWMWYIPQCRECGRRVHEAEARGRKKPPRQARGMR